VTDFIFVKNRLAALGAYPRGDGVPCDVIAMPINAERRVVFDHFAFVMMTVHFSDLMDKMFLIVIKIFLARRRRVLLFQQYKYLRNTALAYLLITPLIMYIARVLPAFAVLSAARSGIFVKCPDFQ
jgi:hypothetical protein